jgi:hypothetical protein
MLHPCVCVALRSTTSTSAGNAAAVAILKTAQACLTKMWLGRKKKKNCACECVSRALSYVNGYQFSVIHFQHVHHAYQVFHAPLIIFQANVKTREHTQPEPEFLVYWYGSQQ